MADFNNPVSTQGYLALLASIVENNKAALQWLEGYSGSSNIPTNAKQFSTTAKRFETWNGSAWVELAALYEIKVRDSDKLNGQLASYYTNASNLASGTLPAGRFDDSAHGARNGGTLHAAATISIAGFMSASDKSKMDGIEPNATADMTDTEILSALLGVDGPGSGLNADMVDGYHGASLLSRANHTGTQSLSTISDAGALASANNISPSQQTDYAAGIYVERSARHEYPYSIGTPTRVLEFKVFRAGTIRVRKGLYQESGNDIRGQIYKNGIAVGALHIQSSQNSWGFWMEDINVSVNDLIQLYIYNYGPVTLMRTYLAILCVQDILTCAPDYNYSGEPPYTF